MMLEDDGYHVEAAENGREALSRPTRMTRRGDPRRHDAGVA